MREIEIYPTADIDLRTSRADGETFVHLRFAEETNDATTGQAAVLVFTLPVFSRLAAALTVAAEEITASEKAGR